MIRQIKRIDRIDDGLWIDIKDPRLHRLRLLLANRPGRRMNLAVDVRQADEIVVDEDEMSDTSTCKSLRHERADAAHTENRHGAVCQLLHSFFSQQQLRAGNRPNLFKIPFPFCYDSLFLRVFGTAVFLRQAEGRDGKCSGRPRRLRLCLHEPGVSSENAFFLTLLSGTLTSGVFITTLSAKSVAMMRVARTSPPSESSITVPRMMLTSGSVCS